MTQEEFDTIQVGDTCQGPSWGGTFKGTVIYKDTDSVLMMEIVGDGRRSMSISSCGFERLELVERSASSAIKEAITDMRPDLQKLMDLTE